MIAYLHGFNSDYNPDDNKIKVLESFDKVIGLRYDTFGSRTEIFKDLLYKAGEAKITAIVGTSLGGYYAAAIARELGIPSILINPSVSPYTGLADSLNAPLKNWRTGKENTLTDEVRNSYIRFNIDSDPDNYDYIPLVLLDEGDKVMSSDATHNILYRFDVIIYPDGSHRFEHMKEAEGDITEYLNICEYITDLDQ